LLRQLELKRTRDSELMDRTAVLVALSRIARKPTAQIADHMVLASLGVSSSLGLSLLRTSLESASGKSLEPLSGMMRVGDLVTLMTNGAVPGAAPAIADAPAAALLAATSLAAATPAVNESMTWPGAIGLGLDIQDVDALPLSSDYRSHEFYRSHFLASEIATAVLRPDARVHLCGIFCAKEAAKKSHPALLEARMNTLVVTHDSGGKPFLGLADGELSAYGFQFIVSISHTHKFAAAACITFARNPGAAAGSLHRR